jgi:hypothetical protein
MVYAVQNYKVYFGLYSSPGIYKTKKQVSETGFVSVLRWGKTLTLLGPLERASLNPVIDPVSETLCFFLVI